MLDRTGAVVALKPLRHAKSRLHPIPAPLRHRLAWCMALDTLRALAAVMGEVVVVSGEPDLRVRLSAAGLAVSVRPDVAGGGINAALASGAANLAATGRTTVLACVADLPSLRPSSVRAVLTASRGRARSFLADASGVGTTMLVARDTALQPHFSGRSAAAHRASGAMALAEDDLPTPVPDARRDVDTEAELADAYRLGLGPATMSLFDPATGQLGRHQTITTVGDEESGTVAAVTAEGVRLRLPLERVAVTPDALLPGQTLQAVTAEDRVLSAWR